MKIQKTNIGNNTKFSGVVVTPQVKAVLSKVQMDVLDKATRTLERISNRDRVDVEILGGLYVGSADSMRKIVDRHVTLVATKKQSWLTTLFRRPKTAEISIDLDNEVISKYMKPWVDALNKAIGKLK